MIHEVLSPPGRFAPLDADHPLVGHVCPGCDQPIKDGDRVSLVNGVADTPEDREKAAKGLAHTARAVGAHESCAYPDEINTEAVNQ